VWLRARMATPFQERSPCQTASYPRVRRAFTGNAPGSALSSWRLTTSGSALANQAKRLSSRLLMLLMLKVATFTRSLSVAVALGAPPKGSSCASSFRLALFHLLKEVENPIPKRIPFCAVSRSPRSLLKKAWFVSGHGFSGAVTGQHLLPLLGAEACPTWVCRTVGSGVISAKITHYRHQRLANEQTFIAGVSSRVN
jgi:hypothetical protein